MILIPLLAASVMMLDVHGLSWHPNPDEPKNEVNPGIGITIYQDDIFFTAGTYYNSRSRDTVYAGMGRKWGRFALIAGAVTGYSDRSDSDTMAVILPRLELGHLNMFYIPEIKGKKHTSEAFMFSTSWKIK